MNKRKHAIKAAKAAKRTPYRKFDLAIEQSIAKAQAARKKRRRKH